MPCYTCQGGLAAIIRNKLKLFVRNVSPSHGSSHKRLAATKNVRLPFDTWKLAEKNRGDEGLSPSKCRSEAEHITNKQIQHVTNNSMPQRFRTMVNSHQMNPIRIEIKKNERGQYEVTDVDQDGDRLVHTCKQYEEVVRAVNTILAANHPDQMKLTEWSE